MLVLDSTTGRFEQDFDVAIARDYLVFQFHDGEATRHSPEGTTEFVDFANLVRHVPNRVFQSMEIGVDDWPMPETDVEHIEPSTDDLLDLATIAGPLFGHACADQENMTVSEPIGAWISAAKVLNFAARADSLTGKPERIIENSIDGDVVYKVSVGIPSERFGTEQMLAETLVQQLVSVHLVNAYVGWGVFYNDKLDRDMDVLGVQFNNYLERLWYTFGLHHAGGKLGICRHCGKLFSADKERKSTKLYCSKRCQEAEKDERAKARKRRRREQEAARNGI